jgi:hypothetical protein
MSEGMYHGRAAAKIPANVDQEDRVLLGLTVRQAGILAATAVALYLLFQASRPLVPPLVFLPLGALVLVLVAVAVTMSRDGLSLDRFALTALRHARSPKRQALAPEGVGRPPNFLDDAMAQSRNDPAPFEAPLRQVESDGVVDLGRDGASLLATCSTVNFALRTPAEQDVLIGGFAQWLNALTGPVQVASSSRPVHLAGRVAALRDAAPGLPHPALEAAAREHADFLEDIAGRGYLLDRGVLLVVHEEGSDAGVHLARRVAEATAHLAGCEVGVRQVEARDATAIIHAALNP